MDISNTMKVIVCSASNYSLYNQYIQFTSSRNFSAFDFSIIPKSLRKCFDLIKEIVKNTKLSVMEVVNMFREKAIFKFVEKCGFSIKKIYDKIHEAYTDTLKLILDQINDYVQSTPVGKWTEKELRKLDEWLSKNPKIKRIGGVALAAFLIFMNLNVTYIGDFEFDFDMDSIAKALLGNYTFSDVLGGSSGVALVTLFLTNAAGLSFPWSTPIKLIGILGNTLYRLYKNKDE